MTRKDDPPVEEEASLEPRRVTLSTATPFAEFHHTGTGVVEGDLVITNSGVSLPVDAAAEVLAAARWAGVALIEKD